MPLKKEPFANNSENKFSKTDSKMYWQKWYVAVIGFLLVQVVLYYLITIYFQ